MNRTGLRGRIPIAALAALLALPACERTPERFPEGGGPFEKIIRRNLEPIEEATGLRFKRWPDVRAASLAEVRAFAEKAINEPQATADIEGQTRVYRLLGLLPETLDVKQMLLGVLEEQIVGLYDPETDVLYVRDDKRDDPLLGVIIGHEMIHALQDQYVDLDSLKDIRGDNDRATAIAAVIEGQATYEQMVAMLGGAQQLEMRMAGGWDRVRQMIRDERASMPVLATAPMIIQETLIFPYLSGADFVNRFERQRPDTSPLFDLPVSTEQILHTSAYFGDSRDEPTTVTLPPLRAGRGRAAYENNLGEFETRLFLFEHLNDQDMALRGAAGWDGDRYVLFDTPGGGTGIAWITVWDSAVDGAEFLDVMEQLLRRRYNASLPRVDGSTRVYRGSGRMLALTAREVEGRPAVLFVDVPEGASTDVLDLGAVRLR